MPQEFDVWFGRTNGEDIKWRDFPSDEADDDEELVPTPADVVDLLGFDPREVDAGDAFDPDLHPRHPAGSEHGGEFMLKATGGGKKGSNPGGEYVDPQGNKYYVKFYKDGEQAKVEALAGQLYDQMGIKGLHPQYSLMDGKHAIITRWNPDLDQMSPAWYNNPNAKHALQLGVMYHAAVLTKNWDIVGLEHDNIVRHKKTDDLFSVDQGGVFTFRAQGGPKDYGTDIAEHKSLRNPGLPSGHVFNAAFSQHPTVERSALAAVRTLVPANVRSTFAGSHIADWEKLHDTFNERKRKLLALYGD